MISGNLSIMYGYQGPNIALVTACTTGTHSIGEAGRIIEYGDADIMVAGGAEATISPLGLGGFCAARALSTRNDDPATASRPWDRDRDGFVLGEGAGVLVLEYEHAKARGACIYGELAGYGMSADANHMTAPCEDGSGAARCMVAALKNAGLNADEVQYVNAHGFLLDRWATKAKTIAVKRAFGDHAGKLVVNSTKSMTGHLLGAAGGIEAVFSALAIYNQISPPTISLFNQDEQCDLDYCANEARSMRIDAALSNSSVLAAPTVPWSSAASDDSIGKCISRQSLKSNHRAAFGRRWFCPSARVRWRHARQRALFRRLRFAAFLAGSLQRSLRPFKTTRLMLGMAGEIVLEPGSPREGSANCSVRRLFGWLIVLRLGIDTDPRAELDPDAGTTNRRTTALVVLADSVSPADFRRLQIWLRWVVPSALPASAPEDRRPRPGGGFRIIQRVVEAATFLAFQRAANDQIGGNHQIAQFDQGHG